MDNNKKTTSPDKLRSLKLGGYSIVLSVIVIAAAVLVNLIFEALPESMTVIDLTGADVYQISEDTEKFLDSLDTDITIYYISSAEGRNEQLNSFVKSYAEQSKHITVKYVDPEAEYAFVSEHGVTAENSLVIASELRTETVDYNSIYRYSEEIWNEYYSSYYYYGYAIEDVATPDVFDADNQITSAIDYVTTNNLPVVYSLTGHGEAALSTTISALVDYNNITNKELNLLSSSNTIPEDASIVIINNPTSDITEAEAKALRAFIDNGGKVIMVTDIASYATDVMKNLTAVAEHCGLTAHDGIVLEDNTSYYSQNQYFLVPRLQECAVTASISNPSGVTLVMNRAHAIVEDEDYEGSMLISPVLKTSDTAYIIGEDEEVRARRDDDITGTFYLGAISRNAESDGMLVWYSSSYINSDESMNYVNYNNVYVFGYSITEICDKPITISVDSVPLNVSSYLTFTETSIIICTALVLLLIPLAVLVPGIVIWVIRRRR